jgi:hypothetical protein
VRRVAREALAAAQAQQEATVQTETAGQQIERLSQFIMEHIPGEPSRSEGAVDAAIRLLAAKPRLASNGDFIEID